jgi:hypothetical protein
MIDSIIYNYNHTVNRGIGIEPYKVNKMIENYLIDVKRDETSILKKIVGEKFEINDIVRIKRSKKLFSDKMLSKYGDHLFKVIKDKNNSVLLIDSDGNEHSVKKSHLIKVKQTGEVLPNKPTIELANNEHSLMLKLKREGLDLANILNKRRR